MTAKNHYRRGLVRARADTMLASPPHPLRDKTTNGNWNYVRILNAGEGLKTTGQCSGQVKPAASRQAAQAAVK